MTVRSYQERRHRSSDRVFYKKKQNNKDEYLLDADLQILFDRARSSGLSCSQENVWKLEFLDYEEFISKTPAAFHTTHIGVGKVLECSTNLAG